MLIKFPDNLGNNLGGKKTKKRRKGKKNKKNKIKSRKPIK
jgi:hypothetical protein